MSIFASEDNHLFNYEDYWIVYDSLYQLSIRYIFKIICLEVQ